LKREAKNLLKILQETHVNKTLISKIKQ